MMISCLIATSSFAQSVEERFAAANTLYRDGEFTRAAAGYQEILADGYSSWVLQYNLGNAHVKLGNIAKAMLAYERALKANPRDPELRANWRFAKGLLSDRVEQGPLRALWEKFSPANWISFGEHARAFVGIYWMGALLALTGLLGLRRRALLGIGAGGLALAMFLGLGLFLRSEYGSKPGGIVMDAEIEVRYGPVLAESTAFTLHQGSKVRLLRRQADWVQIAFAKGKVGWVPASAVEKI